MRLYESCKINLMISSTKLKSEYEYLCRSKNLLIASCLYKVSSTNSMLGLANNFSNSITDSFLENLELTNSYSVGKGIIIFSCSMSSLIRSASIDNNGSFAGLYRAIQKPVSIKTLYLLTRIVLNNFIGVAISYPRRLPPRTINEITLNFALCWFFPYYINPVRFR